MACPSSAWDLQALNIVQSVGQHQECADYRDLCRIQHSPVGTDQRGNRTRLNDMPKSHFQMLFRTIFKMPLQSPRGMKYASRDRSDHTVTSSSVNLILKCFSLHFSLHFLSYLFYDRPSNNALTGRVLSIKLNIVRREESRFSPTVTEPPVIIRELQVCDLVAFRKAQFYKMC